MNAQKQIEKAARSICQTRLADDCDKCKVAKDKCVFIKRVIEREGTDNGTINK